VRATVLAMEIHKKLLAVHGGSEVHWVGDGFPVRTVFSYDELGDQLSPFLLLDHAGPSQFPPTEKRRGVGEHPHRGFETVTIVFEGEVEHRDSSGAGGRIGPGDVQWMTAGSGLVHEEFHGREFARHGGALEMVQLWVNLPAKDKMVSPRYQSILAGSIPVFDLGQGRGFLRVVAGEHGGCRGPAQTFTPINVWDILLEDDQPLDLALPGGFNAALVVLRGSLRVNEQVVKSSQVAVLSREGDTIRLGEGNGSRALILSGEPIHEPIVGQGPFVMNTSHEIAEAIADYREGRMGQLS